MNPKYIIPRFARHFLPEKLVRFLLLRGWIIRAGIETSDPAQAAQIYERDLAEAGVSLQGKRVLIFGYGGRFSLGVLLLNLGADEIILVDKFAPPDDTQNVGLLPLNGKYLEEVEGRVIPRPGWITLIEDDIRSVAERSELSPVDIVISSSVYEHLDDVGSITASLAALTKPDGIQIHYVDLRDHYFKYPFEMLCYSEKTWYSWLNPSSHHNRFRVWDYQRVFNKYFNTVDLTVLDRDDEKFEATRTRIRPEFISGNPDDDSVTLIKVIARQPLSSSSIA